MKSMIHYRPTNYAPHYTFMDSVLYPVSCGRRVIILALTDMKRKVTCRDCRRTKKFKKRS